jgi:AraC-like DNA-binding protein
MYFRLSLKTNDKTYNVFLQDGFYSLLNESSSTVHKHNYAEVHIVSGGSSKFKVENAEYTVNDGEFIIIPRGNFHTWTDNSIDSNTVLHTAFIIDTPISEIEIISADTNVVRGFFNEIQKFFKTQNHGIINSYIPLLLSYADKTAEAPQCKNTDDGVLIENFFSTNYASDIHLADLALILNLSPRQTERKILEYTGHTFNEELCATRMAVARYLESSTNMSRSQIAEYVGYKSYAGFWKASKKLSK